MKKHSHVTLKRLGECDVFASFAAACLVVFIAAVFFSSIMPYYGRVWRVALALSVVFSFGWAVRHNIVFRLRMPIIAWLLLFMFFLLNQSSLLFSNLWSNWLTLFSLCLALVFLLGQDPRKWLRIIACAVAIFGLVHAIATGLFWLFPSLYDNFVYPVFFSDALRIVNMGYKSALTTHYSTNGMYLASGLTACVGLALCGKGRSDRVWTAAAAVILFALLLTTKRAHLVFGLSSCAFAFLIWGAGRVSGAATKAITIASVGACVLFVCSTVVPELGDVFDRIMQLSDDDTFGGRLKYYEICWELWGDSPVFGCGWGAFREVLYSTPHGQSLLSWGNTMQTAHNVYFQLLAEGGVVGLALFVWAAFSSLTRTVSIVRTLDADEDAEMRGLATASVAAQVFFLLYGITGGTLYTAQVIAPYLLMLVAASTKEPRVRRARGRYPAIWHRSFGEGE